MEGLSTKNFHANGDLAYKGNMNRSPGWGGGSQGASRDMGPPILEVRKQRGNTWITCDPIKPAF